MSSTYFSKIKDNIDKKSEKSNKQLIYMQVKRKTNKTRKILYDPETTLKSKSE